MVALAGPLFGFAAAAAFAVLSRTVLVCLEVVIFFNFLILAHELGHFLVAKWRGLCVERFAIWFGKPIWSAKVKGVEYCLGSIPAGGYVALPQMASMEAIEGETAQKAEELPSISALDKILVAFAGPLFSFLLALVFAVVVHLVGRPVSESDNTTVIGYVVKDGPAQKSGLRPGDKVLEVDGKPVKRFRGLGETVTWRIVRSEGETVPVKVERDGQVLTFNPAPVKEPTKPWQRKSLRKIMVMPAEKSVIYQVYTNGPAWRAGLRGGDEILTVNGGNVLHWAAIEEHAEQHPKDLMTLGVRRDGTNFSVALMPEVPLPPYGTNAQTGIESWSARADLRLTYPGAWEQVIDSVNAMGATLDAIFSRKSDIKAQHLGGAVQILSIYYLFFESEQGWRMALWFSVVLNVNLALLNLLPFPVLDGGHIALALVEAVRRKPINPRLFRAVQTSCVVLLITYMLYIAFFDVQDLPALRGRDKEAPTLKFAPPAAPAK
jgi:regulator of sigma E protease